MTLHPSRVVAEQSAAFDHLAQKTRLLHSKGWSAEQYLELSAQHSDMARAYANATDARHKLWTAGVINSDGTLTRKWRMRMERAASWLASNR